MIIRKLSDSFESWAPGWITNKDTKMVAYRFIWGLLYPLDVLFEGILQTIVAAMPGLGDDTAASLLGRSRALLRGEDENWTDYAGRLRGWLDTHYHRGAPILLAQLIHLYLANHPRVSIITRRGDWYICHANGETEVVDAVYAEWAWDWDSHSNPERANRWADMWIAIYPCEWPKTTGFRKSHILGLGHDVTRTPVSELVGLIQDWTGAHTFVRAIIWVYDADLFHPDTVNAGNPDGWWGLWAKEVAGNQVCARNSAVRIWEPTGVW